MGWVIMRKWLKIYMQMNLFLTTFLCHSLHSYEFLFRSQVQKEHSLCKFMTLSSSFLCWNINHLKLSSIIHLALCELPNESSNFSMLYHLINNKLFLLKQLHKNETQRQMMYRPCPIIDLYHKKTFALNLFPLSNNFFSCGNWYWNEDVRQVSSSSCFIFFPALLPSPSFNAEW